MSEEKKKCLFHMGEINGKTARQIIRIAQKEHLETWTNAMNEMKQIEAINRFMKQ